ncbi:MAG: rhomboid family intramembrane serine protease [Lachnospiraceae bacterium]|nr:rhomboid family intramembrane serine protease [Lachnospiraceae bacterium]
MNYRKSNLEKKFGRYAVRNLSLYLVIGFAIGYVLQLTDSTSTFLYTWLSLDAWKILHGQIWRLFTWVLIPPSSFDFFTLLMLYFYWSVGTMLEKVWGTWKYNVYIFGGILCTIAAAFLCLIYVYVWVGPVWGGDVTAEVMSYYSMYASYYMSTYYITLSIFLGYAATFPDMQVMLFFVIPVKTKVLGVIYLLLLGYYFIQGNIFSKFVIGAALINMGVFLLRNRSSFNPQQIYRRQTARARARTHAPTAKKEEKAPKMKAAVHKCAICGQTEISNPNLEFRYCSKCNGNYEYCSEHLFTHEHVK